MKKIVSNGYLTPLGVLNDHLFKSNKTSIILWILIGIIIGVDLPFGRNN